MIFLQPKSLNKRQEADQMTTSLKQIMIIALAAVITWFACADIQASEEALISAEEDKNPPAVLVQMTFGGVARSDAGNTGAAYTLGCSALEIIAGPAKGSFKLLHFSWENPEAYIIDTDGRDPWENLYEVTLGANHVGMITARTGYAMLLGATSAFERETADSFSFYGGGFGIFAISPKWTISAGAIYSKHQTVKADFEIIPVANVSWNTATNWGPSFTIGLPETELTWHFSKNTTLTATTSGFESGIYRLADNSPVREKGYVEFSGTTAALRLDTLIADRIGLSAGLSQAISRKQSLYDSDGKNEIKYDVEKKPGLFITFLIPF
jgi:hypothetical protein